MVTDAISAELMQAMDSLCRQCGITSDHFINSTFEVMGDTVYSVVGVYYTSYIVYSSPEGNVMASTVVTLLQQWLLESEENKMQVTVGEAHLVIYKPCGLEHNNPTSKALCLIWWLESALCPSPTDAKFVLVAGTFVSGLVAGIICMVIGALSWSVKIVTMCSPHNFILNFFSHAAYLCTRDYRVIPLTTHMLKLN